jgi:pyrroloquinoline-quinone synthase
LSVLDETVAGYSLLDHPFYEAWSEGKLAKSALIDYAKQYYAHVRNFPVYLSAIHSRCPDAPVRQLILENLVDEELGTENHPELWLRFTDGLGVPRRDVQEARLLPSTVQSVSVLKSLTTSGNYLRGVAALYAYESQVPEIAKSKRQGLKLFYGIDDAKALSYFTTHEEADITHRSAERNILKEKATTEDARRDVIEAAEAGARAMWTFLDGCYDACMKAV